VAQGKIRIAVVITGLGLGGMETRQLTVARYIDRERYHLDFYCLYDENNVLIPEFEELGIRVRVVKVFDYSKPFPFRLNLFAILRLAILLRKGKYDVIHTQLRDANTVGRIAAILSGKCPMVATICNMEERSRFQQFWDRHLGRIGLKIMCISDAVLRYDMSHTKLPEEKYVRIHNGIDIDRFSREKAHMSKAALGLPESAFVIGSVGRLHKQKDFKTLIRAFKNVHGNIPESFLVIAGEGNEYAELKKLSENLGVSERARLIGARKDIPEIMSCFDIFILPSIYEGFGNVVIEAMSMEVPVISTDLPPVREILTPGEDGIMVSPGKQEEISHEIMRLYKDEALRRRLSTNGRKTVMEKFSQYVMVRNIEKLYEEASNRRFSKET
jgi:glycosyltransferase involved in cell wall biosynthesis